MYVCKSRNFPVEYKDDFFNVEDYMKRGHRYANYCLNDSNLKLQNQKWILITYAVIENDLHSLLTYIGVFKLNERSFANVYYI